MPRQNKAHELLGRKVVSRWRWSADERSPREKEWAKSYRRMHPTWVDKRTPKPHIKTGKLRQDVRTKLSWLMRNAQANGRWVHAQPRNPAYTKSAHAVEIELNNQFRDPGLDNEERLMVAAWLALKYGDNTCVCRWHEDGPISGCRVEPINNYDVFPDWGSKRWVIIRRLLTFQELAVEAERIERLRTEIDPETGEEITFSQGNGTAFKALKQIEKAIKEDHIFERWGILESDDKDKNAIDHSRTGGSSRERHRDDVKPSEDPRNALITLLEYHELSYDGRVAMVIPDNPNISFGQEAHLVFMEEQPHPYGMPMIVRLIPNWEDDEWWGYGIPEIAGDAADIEDITTRALIKNVFRYGDPLRVYSRDARINSSYLKKGGGVSIPVQDTQTDIAYVTPPQNNLHQLASQLMSRAGDRKIGESEQRRGSTGGTNTATEAAIAEQGAQTDDLIVAKKFFMFIQKVANCFLHIMRVEMTEDRLIPDLGRNTPVFTNLMASDFEPDYFIFAGGMLWGGNPAIRQASLRANFQSYGGTGVLNPRKYAEADLREVGIQNPEEFLLPPEGPEPVEPRIEHKMLRTGQQIQVSPQDDDRAHLVEHGAELQIMQQDGTSPVVALELQKHLLQHIQSAQIKQTQLGQIGAPGSGPQPFQPAQAGQPGQPTAFNGRTADINQQRQAPQDGLSPQPFGAPGRPGIVR